jgi:MFS family permease
LVDGLACDAIGRSIPWGWISDRFGRKPALLMGILGTSIAILMFGFAENYTWAICCRSAAGLLSGIMKHNSSKQTTTTTTSTNTNRIDHR